MNSEKIIEYLQERYTSKYRVLAVGLFGSFLESPETSSDIVVISNRKVFLKEYFIVDGFRFEVVLSTESFFQEMIKKRQSAWMGIFAKLVITYDPKKLMLNLTKLAGNTLLEKAPQASIQSLRHDYYYANVSIEKLQKYGAVNDLEDKIYTLELSRWLLKLYCLSEQKSFDSSYKQLSEQLNRYLPTLHELMAKPGNENTHDELISFSHDLLKEIDKKYNNELSKEGEISKQELSFSPRFR